jgi:hypothetical protein
MECAASSTSPAAVLSEQRASTSFGQLHHPDNTEDSPSSHVRYPKPVRVARSRRAILPAETQDEIAPLRIATLPTARALASLRGS